MITQLTLFSPPHLMQTKEKIHNEEFQSSYTKMINNFTKEFTNDFCSNNGEINWNELVRFNSQK